MAKGSSLNRKQTIKDVKIINHVKNMLRRNIGKYNTLSFSGIF